MTDEKSIDEKSAPARSISDKRGGAVKTMRNTPAPRPLFKGNISSLIVCLCLADCRLLQ